MKDLVANRAVFERYLTEREEKKLFTHVAAFESPLAQRDLAWMRLLRQTGIRVGSLSKLTLEMGRDALMTNRLDIRSDIAKGEVGYSVALNTVAQRAVRDLIRARRRMGFNEIPEDPLILSTRGRALSVRSFQARMQQWVREAGLQVAASPHWMRHTLAKRVIARSEARDPLGIVQAALGQRSRQSAAIYTLPDREEVARELERAR
jgi:site-specific recombinase XerC